MNWHTFWRRITSTRYSRELEREVLHERAEAIRLRDEAAHEREESAWQRVEVVRERTENARLRAETRALLNSILGIAGIPPVLADISAAEAVVPRAGIEIKLAANQADGETPAEGFNMDRDLILTNPDTPRSPSPHTRNTSDEFPPTESPAQAAREVAAHQLTPHEFPADAGASAASKSPGSGHPANTRLTPDSSRATQGASRPAFSRSRVPRVKSVFDKQQTATPTRRRSWHQINRQLELASARKAVTSDE
jgi:hypothetical protein